MTELRELDSSDFLPLVTASAPVPRKRQALVSLGVAGILVLFIFLGPKLWPADPERQDSLRVSEPPGTRRHLLVLPDPAPWRDALVPGVPGSPRADGRSLKAPARLRLVGEPTLQSVRLRWDPVPGAASYVIYRSDRPARAERWGTAIGEVSGGNRVSFEDRSRLQPRTYIYSVVARNGDLSPEAATLEVSLPPSLLWSEAQRIRPGIQVGETLELGGHPLGTDFLGRDLLARLMAAGKTSLGIGIAAPLLAALLGAWIGTWSARRGGRADLWLMRAADIVNALPFLLTVVLARALVGSVLPEVGPWTLMWVIAAISWPRAARVAHDQALGLGRRASILATAAHAIPLAILAGDFLAFIGIGAFPQQISWGSLCRDGILVFRSHPHELLLPATFLGASVLVFRRAAVGASSWAGRS